MSDAERVLHEADRQRVFRAAFDIAGGFGLPLESAVELALRLTREAFDGAADLRP